MNNAERRLQEVEERLKNFEAPEPPASLLESIQVEIPEDLGGQTHAPDAPAHRRFLKLAASLAVVAVGGVLGYRLLEEGPAPGDVVTPEVPIAELEPLRTPGKAEIEGLSTIGSLDLELGETKSASGGPIPSPAREDSITVTSESPLVDEVKLSSGRSVGRTEVEEIPSTPAGSAEPASGVRNELGEVFPSRGEADEDVARRRQELLSRLRELEQRKRDGRDSAAPALPKPRAKRVPIPDLSEAVLLAPPAVADEVSVLEDASHLGYNRQVVEEELSLAVAHHLLGSLAGEEAQNRELNALRSEQAALKQLLKASPGVASPSTGGTTEPNDQPYGDMFFQGYGTNPFVDTEDDPQSTFGLDVDTASYTMARSYLRRGDLPPADAIRVEEFVNFFDYGDRAPRSRDFAVVAEGAPSPFASTARTYLLRFALKGREVSARQRKAAVLTFVVDVSGSMNRENRLGLVQRALGLLVQQLDEGDAIGLVVYGSHGQVILDPTSDHRRVMAAIEGLRPGGSTNVEEGLVLGYQTARRFFRPGAINRVILCSDGVANVGRTGPDSILARIEREADAGIELTTVGFGMGNYNDVLMEQLADKGDGNYAYVDDLDEARRVFVENLTGTLQTIAGDAKVQVEFDPRMVQSYRLLGYENRDIADRDFRNDAVDAGEIGAGHQVTALYEVKMRDARPKRGKIATLRLRYRSRRSGRVVEDAVDLQRSDLAGSWSGASRGLRLAAVAAEFAEVLRGSYWAREGDLRALESRARGLARSGAWDSDIAELAELISTAARLAEASQTPLGADGIER